MPTVAEELDGEPLTAAGLAEAITEAANRVSPGVPLKPAEIGEDGLPTGEALGEMLEFANDLAVADAAAGQELAGVPLVDGPSAAMKESATRVREAARAHREGSDR